MYSARNIALYLISIDEAGLFNMNLIRRNGHDLYEGNARLNKYIHLAHNIWYAKTGNRLCSDDFYAYDNGAVTLPVQENYSLLHRLNMTEQLSCDVEEFLKKIYFLFRNAEIDEIIKLDHQDPAWIEKNHFTSKKEQIMNSDGYLEDYRKRYADVIELLDSERFYDEC